MVSHGRRPPVHLWVGILLLAICWPLNWMLPGLRTHLLFFPLWLGYVLVVDAIVAIRSGDSILRRSPRSFLLLFAASVPVWWLFELLNLRVQNWHYDGREHFSDLEYAVLASISFSTVIPAVFETAELWSTFAWTKRFRSRQPLAVTPALAAKWFATGIVMLLLLLLFPRLAYPLTWISLFLILDPIARQLGRGSLLDHLARGDWQVAVTLPLGAITCGFFWEMWNWYSYPKWIYSTPGVEFAYIFEMPALGYFGYLPFALELYATAHLLLGTLVTETPGWTRGAADADGVAGVHGA